MKKKLLPVFAIIGLIAFTLAATRTALAKDASAKVSKTSPNPAQAAALADIDKTFGFVPHFLSDIPPLALPGAWEEMKDLQMNGKTALPNKVKELIGLGVSAQIPCQYCILAHTDFARANGASEEEIGEAVALSSLARHWSTYLNGAQIDEAKFDSEIATVLANMKKQSQAGGQPKQQQPINVVDGKSALQEASQMFGFEPDFLKRFPDAARAGAWKGMRDVEMNPNTALPAKYKDLIELGVSAQIPCHYCITANTQFAKADGATDAEINEAVAQAALTRQFSTLVNGMKTDMALFKSDVARMIKASQASATPQSQKQAAVR